MLGKYFKEEIGRRGRWGKREVEERQGMERLERSLRREVCFNIGNKPEIVTRCCYGSWYKIVPKLSLNVLCNCNQVIRVLALLDPPR